MEQVLPPQTQRGAGFEPPRVHQFTILMENRVGRLQSLVRALEDRHDQVRAISIEESGDSALVRLICSDSDAARETFQKSGVSFVESELLAVELPSNNHQPLVAICASLLAAELNIHYAYPFLAPPRGPALALYVDDPTLAAQLLIRKGFDLIAESDLNKS